MEGWEELLDVILDQTFIPLAAALVIVAVVGCGWWNTRWKRTFWLVGLVLFVAAFYLGIQRHEWGEVLFNGQLL